ncbi:MAG TPA: ATP-binding protein [Stellaceae bacterium]|nr:ATP-binding protein [Stellaceae bacterium]
MKSRLLRVALERDTDIVLARRRTRRIAELLGYDHHAQTRITTAVSELARNAVEHGKGGWIEFAIEPEDRPKLKIVVADRGPGIPDRRNGDQHRAGGGMGIGLVGAQRLVGNLSIETSPERGTRIVVSEPLPNAAPQVTKDPLARIAEALASDAPADPVDEIRQQNREMLIQLEELEKRREDLTHLNQELQDTNRGVVALYAELDERADHLRRADELKSRFLSNMTHEFRTPLNSILALTRLLLAQTDGALTPEQTTQVHFIRKSAENLSELVNDLLDLAKVAAGKTAVTPIEFTVDSLFGALRGMLRPLLVGDAVALVFADCGDVPTLLTDEAKVSQILRNFLSNALKFTPSGEVRVWAVAEPDADTITFSVRDTGIGIAPENIELIFEEFGQVPGPIQSKVKGTGLGLPLSKKLAELLGGKIWVSSAPGQGSVFSLTIPRLYPHLPEIEEGAEITLDGGRLPVLVVEDNAADAFAVQRALAGSLYQPVEAHSIVGARRLLERFDPVAILLDVVLLGDECWRYLIELKQNERTQGIPVVVVSSSGDKRKAINLGADEYLEKPIEPEQLITALQRWTGNGSVTTVLIVDDEPVSRYLVRRLLPASAFKVIEAATGVEGLAQVQDRAPNIVLLDLNLPEMDGFEFLRRLSVERNGAKPPVVILTSMVLDREQRLQLGNLAQVLSKAELSAVSLVGAIRHALG